MYLGIICQYIKNVFFTSGPSPALSSLFLALCGNKNVKRYYVIMLLCYYVMRSLFLSSQRPAPLVSPYYMI